MERFVALAHAMAAYHLDRPEVASASHGVGAVMLAAIAGDKLR